jgi:hypothetical protein
VFVFVSFAHAIVSFVHAKKQPLTPKVSSRAWCVAGARLEEQERMKRRGGGLAEGNSLGARSSSTWGRQGGAKGGRQGQVVGSGVYKRVENGRTARERPRAVTA